MTELAKSLERKMFFFVALLIGSNAYFVQRVISSVDETTREVETLKEHVARIETELKFIGQVDPESLQGLYQENKHEECLKL